MRIRRPEGLYPGQLPRSPLRWSVAQEDYTPTSILITGGCGFIASHVVLLLAKKYPNYKVRPRSSAAACSCALHAGYSRSPLAHAPRRAAACTIPAWPIPDRRDGQDGLLRVNPQH